MAIATEKYIRKPLYVDAVRITHKNFEEMAAWCQGEIQQDEVPGEGSSKLYIKVRVHNPKNPRQTKAFVGDWILYTDRGYKIYTNKAFHASFDVVTQPLPGLEDIKQVEPVRDIPKFYIDPESGELTETSPHKHATPLELPELFNIIRNELVGGEVETGMPLVEEPVDVRAYVDKEIRDANVTRIGEEIHGGEPGIVGPEVKLHSVGPVVGTPGPGTAIGEFTAVEQTPEEKIQEERRIERAHEAGVKAGQNSPKTALEAQAEYEAARAAVVPSLDKARVAKPNAEDIAEAMLTTPEARADLGIHQASNVEETSQQEKIEPAAAEGKRVLSIAEQRELTRDEIRSLLQSGEAVLAQDIAQP